MIYKKASAYYNACVALCSDSVKFVHWYYQASIITDKGEHLLDGVDLIETTRDFVNGYCDLMIIGVRVLKQHYIEQIYPHRDTLKLRLKKTQVPEKEIGMVLNSREVHSRIYRAFLVNPIDMSTDTKSTTTPNDTTDANADNQYIQIKIQLMVPMHEMLAKATFGGVFDGQPLETVRGLLTELFNQYKTGDHQIVGVDIIPPNNTKHYNGIVLPHGTRAVDIPRIIQEKWYGFYDHGVGSYMNDTHWHIYPLWDTSRFHREKYRLVISLLPKIKLADNPRTYHINKAEINVLVTGDSDQKDRTAQDGTNDAQGSAWVSPDEVKNRPIKHDADGVKINSSPTVHRSTNLVGGDNSHLNYRDGITQNAPSMKSEMAKNAVTLNTYIWEYAHPMVLIPGMACKVVRYVGNDRYETHGTLVHVHSIIQPAGRESMKRHTCTAAITVAVDPNEVKSSEFEQFGEKSKGSSGGWMNTIKSWF